MTTRSAGTAPWTTEPHGLIQCRYDVVPAGDVHVHRDGYFGGGQFSDHDAVGGLGVEGPGALIDAEVARRGPDGRDMCTSDGTVYRQLRGGEVVQRDQDGPLCERNRWQAVQGTRVEVPAAVPVVSADFRAGGSGQLQAKS